MNPDQEHYREALPEEAIDYTQETPRPGLLDVVKIDNRWAQVYGGGNIVKFLDDNSYHPIQWNDYVLLRKWRGAVSVRTYREFKPGDMNDAHVQNIHWAEDQAKNPEYLKSQTHVFGEYKKKENNV